MGSQIATLQDRRAARREAEEVAWVQGWERGKGGQGLRREPELGHARVQVGGPGHPTSIGTSNLQHGQLIFSQSYKKCYVGQLDSSVG